MRRLWLGAATASVVVLLASCTAASPKVRVELADVPDLARGLGCRTIQVLNADMAFYDDMRGLNCFFGASATVLFRAYHHDTSIGQVLPDVAPTISAENQILLGTNWYATGTPTKLRELANLLHSSATPIAELTAQRMPKPVPLTAQQEALGSCSSYVTGVIQSEALHPEDVASLTENSEETYPHLTDIATRVGAEVKGRGVTEENFDELVTGYASEVRAYCRQIFP
jgi:hypothetical protein